MLRKTLLALVLTSIVCSVAPAQEWAEKMFQTKEHDFGMVAKSAKTEYAFVVTNPYVEDVHIASVQTSCGCTTPSITKPTLKTWEKGSILAVFNTPSFDGQHGATLTVTFDKPYFAQVQLHVSGFIRDDVVLNPGGVDFGTVEQGTPAEKGIAIGYYGSSTWKILDVKSPDPSLTARLVEFQRNDGQVVYHLFVGLRKDAPAGPINDHLQLITNMGSAVPVAVYGLVQASISVSPTVLVMGVVQPGQKVTRTLVVRGTKPFRVVSAQCRGRGFQCDLAGETEAKTLHLLPVIFSAGRQAGRVTGTIEIQTDSGKVLPVAVSAMVAPTSVANNQ